MKKLEKKDTVVWYIAHNAENVFHFGKLEAGLELQTGQPILEEFETEGEMSERLNFLNSDSKYYEKYLESIKEKDEDYDEYADFDPDKK